MQKPEDIVRQKRGNGMLKSMQRAQEMLDSLRKAKGMLESIQKAKAILESAGMKIKGRTTDKRTLGKNESIAYSDLPWADKQTTIAESKGNLFKSRRLNEAMERIFEDATEAGAKEKYEEDFLK